MSSDNDGGRGRLELGGMKRVEAAAVGTGIRGS